MKFIINILALALCASAGNAETGLMSRIESFIGTPVLVFTGDGSGQVPATIGLVKETAMGLLPSWDVGDGGVGTCILSLSPFTDGFLAKGGTTPTSFFCTMEGWDGFTNIQLAKY